MVAFDIEKNTKHFENCLERMESDGSTDFRHHCYDIFSAAIEEIKRLRAEVDTKSDEYVIENLALKFSASMSPVKVDQIKEWLKNTVDFESFRRKREESHD